MRTPVPFDGVNRSPSAANDFRVWRGLIGPFEANPSNADGGPIMVEDRVVLIDGVDEETALGRAIEVAEEYEDEFETDAGESGVIRFEGIVALTTACAHLLPAAGTPECGLAVEEA